MVFKIIFFKILQKKFLARRKLEKFKLTSNVFLKNTTQTSQASWATKKREISLRVSTLFSKKLEILRKKKKISFLEL